MTSEEQGNNQDVVEKSLHEKRSFYVLAVSSVLLFVITATVISAIWVMNNREIKTYNQLATGNNSEEGLIRGANTTDPEYLLELVANLNRYEFVLYGSDNNIKTLKQKELFGQAVGEIDYVECDSQIKSANSAECLARDIKNYPTWVSGDQKFEGYKSLQELEEIILELSGL